MSKLKQFVIAAGGGGSRLVKSGIDTAKCLVEVDGETVLQRALVSLKAQGFNRGLILTFHRSNEVIDFCKAHNNFGLELTFIQEPHALGNGGALVNAKNSLDERFLYIYGDLIFNCDFSRMHEFHQTVNSELTLLAHPSDHPLDADTLETAEDGRLLKVYTYPHKSRPIPNLLNAAIYIVERQVLDTFDVKHFDFAQHGIPLLSSLQKRIFVFRSREYVRDMGTPERLKVVNEHLRTKLPDKMRHSNPLPMIVFEDTMIMNEIENFKNPSNRCDENKLELVLTTLNNNGILTAYTKSKYNTTLGHSQQINYHLEIQDFYGARLCYFDTSIDVDGPSLPSEIKKVNRRFNLDMKETHFICADGSPLQDELRSVGLQITDLDELLAIMTQILNFEDNGFTLQDALRNNLL